MGRCWNSNTIHNSVKFEFGVLISSDGIPSFLMQNIFGQDIPVGHQPLKREIHDLNFYSYLDSFMISKDIQKIVPQRIAAVKIQYCPAELIISWMGIAEWAGMSWLSDLLNASFVNLKICSKSLFDFTIEGIHPWRTELRVCGARTGFSFYNVFILQVPFLWLDGHRGRSECNFEDYFTLTIKKY